MEEDESSHTYVRGCMGKRDQRQVSSHRHVRRPWKENFGQVSLDTCVDTLEFHLDAYALTREDTLERENFIIVKKLEETI